MAQLNWKYYSLTGIPYTIDMYHGDDSGHLIIFVNSEIVTINFNQKETKTYNFYIENQLVELEIDNSEGTYNYTLTPQKLDQEISKEKTFDHHFWIPLIIIFLAINLLLIIILSFWKT